MINKLNKKVVSSRKWWERFQEREGSKIFWGGSSVGREAVVLVVARLRGKRGRGRSRARVNECSPKLFHNIVLAKCYRFLIALLLNIIDY